MSSLYIQNEFKKTKIGQIPPEWKCSTISDIAEVNPKPIKLDNDETYVSFVGMADVSESAQLVTSTNKNYGEVKKGFTSFCDDDVLVAKITPCFENGKGALANNLTNGIGFGSTEFHVIRAKASLGCPEFIHHITTSHNFRAKGEMNMTGTAGQKRVGKEFIASYLIACPPFPEQQKIAEILSTVDKKIDLIDQKIAETQKLKTGLMQKLFSEGVGVQDKDGNWQPHTEFKDSPVGKIPKTWRDGRISNYVKELISGVSVNSFDKKKDDNELGILKTSAVLGGEFFPEQHKTIKLEDIDRAKSTVKKDTLIISRMNTPALVGEFGYASSDFIDLYLPDRLWMTVPTDKPHCVKALSYLLQFEPIRKAIKELATGTSNSMKNISKGKFLNVYVPQIPFDEQIKIKDIISTVDSKIMLLKKQKSETQQLKKGLMQKLLTGEWRVPVDESEAA
ncbi:restriction endonuclease subunit S [Vibrio furnissii]|uniref:restriction endonuclease subunit S n=1 Tax=Vibrio furnissii TaxID=29494 RepID=UPI001EEA054C|nr:restriction endonuclease subunit S [Vibrio furnissii]MCG6231522.1 restriction endonuclease subunit S [Vibrio furnissii]MCG6261447.1 restriction endonuclease subunit S [Vibrio furnissii]